METMKDLTVRQVLRMVRRAVAVLPQGAYIASPIRFECDRGTLLVRNASTDDGFFLLGVYEAELLNERYETVKFYKVKP